MKYIVYASNDNGEGYVQEIGRYDDLQEVQIRIAMFASDVVITIEQDYDDEEK